MTRRGPRREKTSAGAEDYSVLARAEPDQGVGGDQAQGTHPGTGTPVHLDGTTHVEEEETEFPPLHLSGTKKSKKKKTPKGKKPTKK